MVTWGEIVSWTVLTAPMLPFMAGLSLLDLNELINNPIHHDVGLPSMLTKLPSHIPKFEGIDGDDLTNHVWSFHMSWFSNSITNDSIHLWLFQCTLTGDTTKWYVDQPSTSHSIFTMLSKSFLAYFQLPLQYDIGIELLTTLNQSSATHLSHHAQEWHWRRSTCHDLRAFRRSCPSILVSYEPFIPHWESCHIPFSSDRGRSSWNLFEIWSHLCSISSCLYQHLRAPSSWRLLTIAMDPFTLFTRSSV